MFDWLSKALSNQLSEVWAFNGFEDFLFLEKNIFLNNKILVSASLCTSLYKVFSASITDSKHPKVRP